MNLLIWLNSIEESIKQLNISRISSGKVPDLVRSKIFISQVEGVRSEIEVFHKFAIIELDNQIAKAKEQIANLTSSA